LSKDSSSRVVRVVGSKQQVFFEFSINKTRFPVLKSCKILPRTNNHNDNNTSSTEEHKIDPIEQKMPGLTNQDAIANLPSESNDNESTHSATDKDDDDVTVQTSNSNSTKPAWKSYNIKLLLTSKHDTSDNALQHAMLTTLETIDRELGADTKNKQQVTDFQFQSVTTFRSKFPVSCSKAHQKHNRSATAWVLFTVHT
jgi:hypothetical protein